MRAARSDQTSQLPLKGLDGGSVLDDTIHAWPLLQFRYSIFPLKAGDNLDNNKKRKKLRHPVVDTDLLQVYRCVLRHSS